MGTKHVAWSKAENEIVVAYTAAALSGLLANPSGGFGTNPLKDTIEEATDIAEAVIALYEEEDSIVRPAAIDALDTILISTISGLCASPEQWGSECKVIAERIMNVAMATHKHLLEHLPKATRAELEAEDEENEQDEDDEDEDDEDA